MRMELGFGDGVQVIELPERNVLGVTSRGTPVDIVRTVAEADRRICLGNIEFHYFAGYSGGAKAIMPGCSTPAAIQKNHSHMVESDAHAGKLAGKRIFEAP